jgi:REP element-mobilizing transposase RayT
MPRAIRHFPSGVVEEIADRCIDEAFLLLPDRPEVARIVETAWREGLALFAVELLVLVVMSNHWHAIVRSTTADQTAIPRLMQYVKSRVAREINELRGRRGTFWAHRYHAIPILDDESLAHRLAYALHNPVKAGLCATAAQWRGLSTLEANTGDRATFGRLNLPVSPPTLSSERLEEGRRDAARRPLREALRAREHAAAADRRARGLARPRPGQVLASVTWRDRSKAPSRTRAPRCFAATSAARREFEHGRHELMRSYRGAADAFRAGALDVVFPAGMFAPRLDRPFKEADT